MRGEGGRREGGWMEGERMEGGRREGGRQGAAICSELCRLLELGERCNCVGETAEQA